MTSQRQEHRIGRWVGCASTVVAFVFLLGGAASAASDWDPADVDGPLDLRWSSAAFHGDRVRITISLYEGFTPTAIPRFDHRRRWSPGDVHVELADFLEGWLYRRNGNVIMYWGDFGSSCCQVALVHRVLQDVLMIDFEAPCDGADPSIDVQISTRWQASPAPSQIDRMDNLYLGAPPSCDFTER